MTKLGWAIRARDTKVFACVVATVSLLCGLQGNGAADALTSIRLSTATLDFRTATPVVATAFDTHQTLTITNTGPNAFFLSGAVAPLDFGVGYSFGPCDSSRNPAGLPPGESCEVYVYFAPFTSEVPVEPILLYGNFAGSPLAIPILWQGALPVPIQLGAHELDFGTLSTGDRSPAQVLTMTNIAAEPIDFEVRVRGTSCIGIISPCTDATEGGSIAIEGGCTHLEAGQSCTALVRFAPTVSGEFVVRDGVSVDLGALDVYPGQGIAHAQTLFVGGTADAPLFTSGAVRAVEYWYDVLGHYFLTADPVEMAALDQDPLHRWKRTGLSFGVYPPGVSHPAGSTPVCRFYGRPEAGLDTHFYSASPAECQAVLAKWPNAWLLESDAVFWVYLPDPVSGYCPAQSRPLYRAYNNRPDVNHRFTTRTAIFNDQTSYRRWVPEGYGQGGAMCVLW